MTDEQTLSEKRYKSYEPDFHYKEEDVKEFIRKLKYRLEFINDLKDRKFMKIEIDKLIGEYLK
ncbi:MAG: hypothetical protein AABY22_20600 [Nanoarchaeota archaeon]